MTKLTKAQRAKFSKEKKNYNARVKYQVEKWQKKYPGMDAEAIMRTGIVPWKMTKKLTDIKTKGEYDALMKIMRQSKTKKHANMVKKETRETLKDVLDYAYFPSPQERAEMFKIIDQMTSDELMDFRLSNPQLVKNYFVTYDIEYNGADLEMPEDRQAGLDKVMEALRKYKKDKKKARK